MSACFALSFTSLRELALVLFSPCASFCWLAFLSDFCAADYCTFVTGTKLERGRDLFEQAVSKVPASFARVIFLLYAQYEEQYGLTKHAMHIYERAASAVEPGEKAQVSAVLFVCIYPVCMSCLLSFITDLGV